ncbi:hypothetical protein RFI_11585 [Reticulomyxa filosa]|uniref:Uncharacterized protein n=1 Tax=Reticulomyxa filosa TaxID=46433 RepID=X6NJM1_RETFI|nr:hypothetical protein RFI_11585 [Reticulomyxa filosa]|eukprot:ETO25552.1 hypothetical protein RFI_11585 [Reticulomyxa filosa]
MDNSTVLKKRETQNLFPKAKTKVHVQTAEDTQQKQTLLDYVQRKRPKWSVHKIHSFVKKCGENQRMIETNLDFEDHYDSLWATLAKDEEGQEELKGKAGSDKIQFCKQYLRALQWLNKRENRESIILNFAYYDFTFVQKIYRVFFVTEDEQYQMRLAMYLLDILQLFTTMFSLDEEQKANIMTMKDAIFSVSRDKAVGKREGLYIIVFKKKKRQIFFF